ncbi:MAG: enoyl-CoA hydratase/isomerase family protein [bacterium]|nr:enoyl-CoA hydratase/isomerase family protein [bacterium]
MTNDPIQLYESNGIARLMLCRPPRNEMDGAFFQCFARFRASVLPGLRVRGLIVSGQGRHFSSGANVAELKTQVTANEEGARTAFLDDNIASFDALACLPYPVVATVGGCCLGSGLELALACNYRIAARNALLGLPEVQFGLMPGCGGTVRLPRLIGRGKAMEMILTGRSVLADEALSLGLVDAVVERRALASTAELLIDRLTAAA